MEVMKWVVLGIAIVMYLLVIIFQEKKVLFTTCAAILIIVLGTIFTDKIFRIPDEVFALDSKFLTSTYALKHSLFHNINWNVIMIYLGCMMMATFFIYSKVPVKIADTIVMNSKNNGLAMVAILVMTGFISIFVENVATVLVMAPIALSLCKKLKINPTNFMIGLAVVSNLQGTATLVGDPPSMIFASYSGYTFNDFFFHEGKMSIFFFVQIGMLVGCLFFYLYFSKTDNNKIEIQSEEVISYFPSILLILMVVGLATLSFMHISFDYASGLFVLGLGIISLIWFIVSQKKSKEEVKSVIKGLDWETIFFLLGIFVVVGAIKEVGLLNSFAHFLSKICNGSKILAFIIILFVSVLISGFVDNVPFIIAMLPVTSTMAVEMGFSKELLMFALLLGSCLGGNVTPFGASANLVSMGILKKEGYEIKFSNWVKIAGPFTLLTVLASSIFLWFVWA